MASFVRPDLAGSIVVEDGELTLIPMRPPHDGDRAAALRVVGPEVRVIGPGRRERGYQERIRVLEDSLDRAGRALSVAECIERGAERRGDRLEREVARVTESERELRQAQHRLILALGALQRENEVLRRSLTAGTRAALPERGGVADRGGAAGSGGAADTREPSRWARVVSAVSRRVRRVLGRA